MAKKSSKSKAIVSSNAFTDYPKYAFLLLLFISPFFKDLNLGAHFYIFIFFLGLIALFSLRNMAYKFDYIDWICFALSLSYGLSIIGSESPRMALMGFIWQLGYLLCFIIVRNMFTKTCDKKMLIYVMIMPLAIITPLSILSKLGLSTINELVVNGRLVGTFYYANAYAALLASSVFLTFVIFFDEEKQERQSSRLRIIGALITYIFAVALFLSASRGGLLVYVIMIIVLLLVYGKQYHIFLRFLGINILSFFSSYAIEYVAETSQLGRLIDVSNADLNATYRFVFYKDGLKIFLDNWLFGTGVGGWELLYPLYQPFQYHSRFAHSSIIQSLVDIGLIGTLLLLIFALIVLYRILFARKHGFTPIEKAASLGFLAIAAHSLIDFDLSLHMVSVYFYICIALICGPPVLDKPGTKIQAGILSGFVVLACLIIGLGDLNAIAADKMVKSGQAPPSKIIDKLKDASRFDPLNTVLLNSLGEHQMDLGIKESNTDLIQAGLLNFDKSINLEPNNYKGYLSKGKLLAKIGEYEEAIQQYEQIIDLMPYQNTGYEFLMRLFISRAIQESNEKWAKEALDVHIRALRQDEKIDARYRSYVMKDNLLSESLMLQFNAGVANIILKEYEAGLDNFRRIRERASESLQAEIDAWMYCAETRLGEKPSFINVNKELVSGVEEILNRFN